MARLPRIELPGVPQHVVVRGNNRALLFGDDADRYVFLKLLAETTGTYGMDLHSFVLMSNHVHLLGTGCEHGAISRAIQALGRRFVRFVNLRKSRTGTLFEGRFRSSIVDSEQYLLTCMRYIESNPVRACMVPHPAAYRWSSFRQNATGSPAPPLVPHEVYRGLARDDTARGEAYVRLFDQELDDGQLQAIRASLQKGRALGSASFTSRITQELGRPAAITSHGGSRSFSGRPPTEEKSRGQSIK